jgi:hypothetical protein
MLLWLRRIAVMLIAVFIGVYLGDWAVYRLRGSPQSKVAVNRYLTVPLKGNKTEIDDLGTQDVPCSRSLFAQSGESPCWQLRRNKNQNVQM